MNYNTFTELLKNGLDSNSISMLFFIKEGIDIEENPKITGFLSTLKRKGLVEEGKLTEAGEQLLYGVQEESIRIVKKKDKEDAYMKYMSYFPASDGWSYKNMSFPKTRAIRKNSDKTKDLFAKALAEVGLDKLIKAIIAEVYAKIEDSIRTKQNKMQFFVNTETYLRNKGYSSWMDEEITAQQEIEYLELFKKGVKAKTSTNETFI
jgi:hypothetical protein